MTFPFYWIDAFADRPFAGNPAGVVPLVAWPDETLMQRLAFEHGLAETAFFARTGEARFQLRWFTPAVEVDLCGHATLAAAHVVFHELGERGDLVTFDTHSGPLTVVRRADGKLELDFPATPVAVETDAADARSVVAALGATPGWLGRSRFDRFAVLSTAAAVRALRPDLAHVAAAGGRGLIVTAPGDGTCDFVLRWFGPQSGIAEDPATGSAQCALAPYWGDRLGKTTLHARQLSARGGELWCTLASSSLPRPAGDRVKIAGHTVLYLRGEIAV